MLYICIYMLFLYDYVKTHISHCAQKIAKLLLVYHYIRESHRIWDRNPSGQRSHTTKDIFSAYF